MRRFIGFALLLLFLTSQPADATEHHLQSWSVYVLRVKVAGPWGAYFEVQPRSDVLDTRIDRLLIRPAVNYALTPELSFWLGYGAIASFDPLSWEHRLWQQVQYEQRWDAISLNHRLRFEERFLTGADSVGLRVRYQARFYFPLYEAAVWGPLFFSEIFVSLNSPSAAVPAGFDQNRAFAGLNFNLGASVRMEAGYLNHYVNRVAPKEGLMNHAGLLGIYLTP